MDVGLETAPSGAGQAARPRCPAPGKPRPGARPRPTCLAASRPGKQPAQDARGRAMADGESVGLEVLDPVGQAGRDFAHNPRRPAPAHSICRGRAAVVTGGIQGARLRLGELVPEAQIDFLDARFGGDSPPAAAPARCARSPWWCAARASGLKRQLIAGRLSPSSRFRMRPISCGLLAAPAAVSGVSFLPEKRFSRLASVWPWRAK